MTELDVAIELEKTLSIEGKIIKRCNKCNGETYRDACPQCGSTDFGAAKTGDEILDRLATGESIDLDELFGRKI